MTDPTRDVVRAHTDRMIAALRAEAEQWTGDAYEMVNVVIEDGPTVAGLAGEVGQHD